MINCTGNKIPLACVFAAIAIVFIHGLSLSVAPSEPETREPEARAWAAAENEEAFYLEWTEGAYHHLRVMPLTEEYYCPQVPVVKGGAVWTTSWSLKRDPAKGGRLAHRPYKCRAVHGHDYAPGTLGLLD